jgi:hypothetical protein
MAETPLPRQIKTVGATQIFNAFATVSSKESYDCANAKITRGLTLPPSTLAQCAEQYPKIKEIADDLGVDMDEPWTGPSVPQSLPEIHDTLLGYDTNLTECNEIKSKLGNDWLGCLWGSPMADFSCTCPEVGDKFANYLKLRLNVATFWNTPIETPAKRAEFLDSIKFAPKTTIVVPGTFDVGPGDVIEIKADNASAYPSSITRSFLSKYYYVVSVKNTVTNTGHHETGIVATTILP